MNFNPAGVFFWGGIAVIAFCCFGPVGAGVACLVAGVHSAIS